MASKKARKDSETALTELATKSQTALKLAKTIMLSEKILNKKLSRALEYYIANWNDPTHPGLFATAFEAIGADPETAVHSQAALAMIAAAFDIHDDIIDQSVSKHGVPTVFGKFKCEIALLLGNAFLIQGFALFGKCLDTPTQSRKVFEIIRQSLFEFGNAHALELDLKQLDKARPDTYLEIIKMKAASIEGDMKIGATLAGGTEKEIESMARYGRLLGTLAMLREEFVDIFDVEELNQRISREYLPIPILYALEDRHLNRKIAGLFAARLKRTDVDSIIEAVFRSEGVRKLKKYMEDLVAESARLTADIKRENIRNKLQELASLTLEDL